MAASNQKWRFSTLAEVVGYGLDNYADGAEMELWGNASEGDGFYSKYKWVDASTDPHDFPSVIKQTVTGGAGRWTQFTKTNAVPVGSILLHGGSTAPTGWLLCDGSLVSRTTYATLFGVVSTAFGAGDGSTTFGVPDLRQRFPIGKAASGTGSTLGGTGGNIDHVHAVDPGSTGTSSDGSHNHTGATGAPSATVAATILAGGAASTTHTHSISSDGAHTHTVDIPSFNSGTANPPFQAVNYIIKY